MSCIAHGSQQANLSMPQPSDAQNTGVVEDIYYSDEDEEGHDDY